MTWLSGVVVFVIIWWIVLFMVLPFGVRREENPEVGHESGAPRNPMLWRKVFITTAIAAVLWGLAYWAITSEMISFRPPA